jgi:hypothetical protein
MSRASEVIASPRFPLHGWAGIALIAVFWPLNWLLDGLRTHWGFFPLWLGYCLAVDGLTFRRRGSSLLKRDPRGYVQLFVISAPLWWLFELINLRTGNWHYVGREAFSDLEYALLASLSFSTVVPAVLGTAELLWPARVVQSFRRRRKLRPSPRAAAWAAGWGLLTLALLLIWPRQFYPLVWIAPYLLLLALNLRLGHRTLLSSTSRGDWRPVVALCAGVLVCAFFWELWNYRSYPKWIYEIPGVDFAHLFEMPLPGYLGYLPFSLELFAAVQLVYGLTGSGRENYVLADTP